jgi:hypothetical protein
MHKTADANNTYSIGVGKIAAKQNESLADRLLLSRKECAKSVSG